MMIFAKHKNIITFLFFTIILAGCAAKKELVEVTPPVKEEIKLPGHYFWAVKPEVNMRAQADISSDKVGHLNDGDSVLVTENVNGWYNIVAGNGSTGWIRSDLLGPKQISPFAKAVSFVDSLTTDQNTELFFDKKLLHKRIYVLFPDPVYASRDLVTGRTRQLVADYQKNVYRGDVTVRVLKPGTQDEYLTHDFPGTINPDVKLPVLPFGILKEVDITDPAEIKLTVESEIISDQNQYLNTARNIVSIYPISYRAVEMRFITDSDSCLMWFREDENGESHNFGKCPGK